MATISASTATNPPDCARRHRRQSLPMRRYRHVALIGQPGQKRLHLGPAQLNGMPSAMEENEHPYPVDIRILRTYAVVQIANTFTHLVQQLSPDIMLSVTFDETSVIASALRWHRSLLAPRCARAKDSYHRRGACRDALACGNSFSRAGDCDEELVGPRSKSHAGGLMGGLVRCACEVFGVGLDELGTDRCIGTSFVGNGCADCSARRSSPSARHHERLA